MLLLGVEKIRKYVVTTFCIGLYLFAIVFSSVLLYCLFYWLFVPKTLFSRNLYFDYEHVDVTNTIPSDRPQVYLPFVTTPLYFETKAQNESKELIIQTYRKSLLSHDELTMTRLFSISSPFDIDLVLELPESKKNVDASMFMITIELLSRNGSVIDTSKRPVMLRHKSYLLQSINTLFYALPMVLGLMEEKQRHYINFYDRYTEPVPILAASTPIWRNTKRF